LKCTLFSKFNREENIDIFFSTTWCRDRLFTSENPNDILKFYDTFSNRDELIQWMKERPKGRAEIIEVEGDKEIIVVIPTADFNGRYAKECRENIFKGLHIIFVESGYPKDPYFNYAHNCNVGIKKAMEYSPKWVVVSNDDMEKIDNIEVLVKDLLKLRRDELIAFAPFGTDIAENSYMEKLNFIGSLSLSFVSKMSVQSSYTEISTLRKRFGVIYFRRKAEFSIKNLFFQKGIFFIISGVFNIVNISFLNRMRNPLFDEVFINGNEDTDLYLFINERHIQTRNIDYKIKNLIGSTLGKNKMRGLRDICNEAYLNFKWFRD
ncbi:MAG: hypothetical protein QXU18_11625, partial [Thermoplasmatales archaeon]